MTDRWSSADVDRHERLIGRGLALWAAGSVTAGAALLASGRAGAGRQHLVWGVVDGAIAARALHATSDRGTSPGVRARRLRRLLLVNAVLDTAYVGTGLALRAGRPGPGAEQDGTAVALQGGFLLVFDLWHAGRLSRPPLAPAASA